MTDFQQHGCTLVKNFIDPQSIETISKYLQHCMNQKQFKLRVSECTTSYVKYADPLIEVVLERSLPEVEQLTGLELFPTYSYTRVYTKGSELKSHTDIPECEVSLTVNVATLGKPWPVWMKVPGKEPVSYTLSPGDAVLYKGCEVKHWRDPATDTDINVQFMLHYVDKTGPNAKLKFDGRTALGINSEIGGM